MTWVWPSTSHLCSPISFAKSDVYLPLSSAAPPSPPLHTHLTIFLLILFLPWPTLVLQADRQKASFTIQDSLWTAFSPCSSFYCFLNVDKRNGTMFTRRVRWKYSVMLIFSWLCINNSGVSKRSLSCRNCFLYLIFAEQENIWLFFSLLHHHQ